LNTMEDKKGRNFTGKPAFILGKYWNKVFFYLVTG